MAKSDEKVEGQPEVEEVDAKAALEKIEADATAAAFSSIRSAGDAQKEAVAPTPEPEIEPEPELEAPKPEVDPFEKRVRSLEGTIGGLRSDLKKQREAMDAIVAARTAAAPSAEQLAAAAGSPTKIAQLRAEFPQFTAALEEGLGEMEASVVGKTMTKAEIERVIAESMSTAVELADLRVRYGSDPRETTMQTPEFVAWITANPDAHTRMGAANTATEVLKVLEEFAVATKKPGSAPSVPRAVKEKSRLDSSIPATSGSGIARTARVKTEMELANEGYLKVRPRR